MVGQQVTLKQFQALIAVEHAGHFRRAAESLNLTQPSLTAQIQNLEEALGMQLVERNRKGATLTPAGREIANRAQRILDAVQGVLDFSELSQNELAGTIRLGTTPTLGPYLMPHVVSALHRKHKDLRLYVRESAARDLEYELAQGVHDVILTQLPATNREFVVRALFREPLYLAFAKDHEFASAASVAPKSLKGEQMLSLSTNYHYHDQIAELAQNFGAQIARDYEGTSLDALRQMVGMGMGVTFLPALYVYSEIRANSEVCVAPLKGRSITRALGLVWRKSAGRARAYHAIADLMREVARRKFKDLQLA